MNFSKKMEELESILKTLEGETISLESALAEFEKGIELVNGEKEKHADKEAVSGNEQNKLWILILAGALLAGAGLYFGFRKKQ